MTVIISFLMNDFEFQIEEVKWRDEESHLRYIRTDVFIEEQHVPEEMEWDEYDDACVHVLVKSNNDAIATGRILENGQIGRMAVLKSYRQSGVGSKILEKLLSVAELKNMKAVFLNSQIDAVSFYRKFGFEEEGDVFDDAGIPHLKMIKFLSK